jgi:hypothetical protein
MKFRAYGFTTFVVFKLFVNVVGNAHKLDISLTAMHYINNT